MNPSRPASPPAAAAAETHRFSLDGSPQADEAIPDCLEPISARLRRVHVLSDAIVRLWPFRGGAAIARRVARRLLPPLEMRTVFESSLGFKLVISPRDGRNYYYLGSYEQGTLHVMKCCLRPGDVFVDAGASIGQMSLLASTLVGSAGRVIAFEPHRDRFRSLVDAIRINRRGNIAAYPLALVEDDSRDAMLFANRASPSLLRTSMQEEGMSVGTARLDRILSQEKVARIRMLKVDVEGFELAVLKGNRDTLSRPDAPIVCIEYSAHSTDPTEAIRHLASVNDYRLYLLSGTKDRASRLKPIASLDRLRTNDNVFCFLPCHLEELAHSGLF